MKITIIGGGSYAWIKDLIGDFLVEEYFSNAQICLMDINEQNLNDVHELCQRLNNMASTNLKITKTTNLDESLKGCDYVIVAVAIGGWDADLNDHMIGRKYGLWNLKGHDIGAAGFSRTLRHVPFMMHVARKMEKYCPSATLMNVTNPLIANTQCVNNYSSIKAHGFCHGVVNHAMAVAELFGAKTPDDLELVTAGVDHCSWLLKFRILGQDAFDLMRKKGFIEKAYQNINITTFDDSFAGIEEERLRFIIWDIIGYFPGISDLHICEFFPQFIKSAELRKYWALNYDRTIDRPATMQRDKQTVLDILAGKIPLKPVPSGEILAKTIAALAGQKKFIDVLNTVNVGQITNLPIGAVVETKCAISSSGICPITVGALPPVLEAIVKPVLTVEHLYMEAAFEWNKKKAVTALGIDPIITEFRGIRKMVDEYFEHAEVVLKKAGIPVKSWQ